MADYSSRLHFQINWGGAKGAFTKVAGLMFPAEAIGRFKQSGFEHFISSIKGQTRSSRIVLGPGVMYANSAFLKWLNTEKWNVAGRKDLTISLLNEKNESVMSWKVKKASPKKVTPKPLKAAGNEVAIESIELAHEEIRIDIK